MNKVCILSTCNLDLIEIHAYTITFFFFLLCSLFPACHALSSVGFSSNVYSLVRLKEYILSGRVFDSILEYSQ